MKKLIALVAMLLCAARLQAAIAVDTATDLGTGNTTTLSASFNNAAGTTMLLFVYGPGLTNNVDPYTSVKYNAVDMTRIAFSTGMASGGTRYNTAIFCLSGGSLATGSHTVAIVGVFGANVAAHAVSFTGANGCTTDGTPVDTGSACCASTISFNYATSVANSWIFVAANGQFAQPIAGAGIANTHFATNSFFSGNSGAVAATTTSLTVGNSANAYELCAVALQEAGGAPSCPKTFSLLGVGC